MAAKDKTPNRTLSIAISKTCQTANCDEHGLISRTKDNGTIEVKCLQHLNPDTDLLSRFLQVL